MLGAWPDTFDSGGDGFLIVSTGFKFFSLGAVLAFPALALIVSRDFWFVSIGGSMNLST